MLALQVQQEPPASVRLGLQAAQGLQDALDLQGRQDLQVLLVPQD